MADLGGERVNDRLRAKKTFYASLDSLLDDESDDLPDSGRHASMRALRHGVVRRHSEPCASALEILPSPTSRANDMARLNETRTSHNISRSNGQIINTLKATSAAKKHPVGVRVVEACNGKAQEVPRAAANSRKTLKRKRGAIQMAPDDQLVFKDLHFYFFPNTNTHPARGKRISKAIEYGATWERNWSDVVTHVIIDKGIAFDSMLQFTNLVSVPSSITVVSEDYPAECIASKALLNSAHIQFKVKGHDLTSSKRTTVTSNASLPLKAPMKNGLVRPSQTPDRSDGRNQATTSAAADLVGSSLDARNPSTVSVGSAPGAAELESAIEKARAFDEVPLDDDHEKDSRQSTSDSAKMCAAGVESGSLLRLLGHTKPSAKNGQEGFQCMQKHLGDETTDTPSPNHATIVTLQQMADYYGHVGEDWRCRAYRKAISTLRNHPTKIDSKEEALTLPQIGDRLAAKIEEIALTNRLRRLESTRAEPRDQILSTFTKIYGVGIAQACRWVEAGYNSLDELLKSAKLTLNQRVGIEHFEDFNTRIPRLEVEQHGAVIRAELHKVDPACEVIIGGSYRRGAFTSGDIDCLITRANTSLSEIHDIVIGRVVPNLKDQGFLIAELAVTSRHDGSKWHGASVLRSHGELAIWRRIDLLLVPSDELGAALIYWTGNDIFNRSLRLLASTKGMRLNQHGLYRDVMRGSGRARLTDGNLIEGRDERKIFEILGVPWRPAEHRNC